MYQIKILPHAEKDLNRLPDKVFDGLKNKIINLANDPRPYGVLKLTNHEGYRLRMGAYRILYRIDDVSKEVFIYRVKHRREAYR